MCPDQTEIREITILKITNMPQIVLDTDKLSNIPYLIPTVSGYGFF